MPLYQPDGLVLFKSLSDFFRNLLLKLFKHMYINSLIYHSQFYKLRMSCESEPVRNLSTTRPMGKVTSDVFATANQKICTVKCYTAHLVYNQELILHATISLCASLVTHLENLKLHQIGVPRMPFAFQFLNCCKCSRPEQLLFVVDVFFFLFLLLCILLKL